MKNYIVLQVLLLFHMQKIFGQENNFIYSNSIEDYQVSSERYITDSGGKIFINVNVWGFVNHPGSHQVFDGIDIITLFSIVGGPKSGANLKNIKILREVPDSDGKVMHKINLHDFLNEGNRSTLINIKPNDTFIVPQKFSSLILGKIGTINTILSLVNLYLQVSREK